MNTMTRILAPAALAMFAFSAQAATISTGGETYAGVANEVQPFASPTRSAGFSDRDLERLYIG